IDRKRNDRCAMSLSSSRVNCSEGSGYNREEDMLYHLSQFGQARSRIAIFFLLAGLTLPGSCDRDSKSPPKNNPPRRNILLVTIHTCRADRIGCYGFGLARTANIDRLAAEGVRCMDDATSAPITMPAHSSILTGLYPPAHGVRDNGAYALSDEIVTLPER